jgi:hypothetical protein
MVFYNKDLRKLILSYSLIGNIETKYKPFNNNNTLELFCEKIVNYILKKIIQYENLGLPHFYLSSIDHSLRLYIRVTEYKYNKISLFGKIIIKKNGRKNTLSYDLFDITNYSINKLYKIRRDTKIFNKKVFDDIEYINFMQNNTNKILKIRKDIFNKLLKTLRKKIYLVYCTTL